MNVDPQTFPPVFIQAVPWEQARVKIVKTLVEQLDGFDVTVVWDQERSGFLTFNEVQRQMAVHPRGAELGTILLEDDVILGKRWAESVLAAIQAYPGWMLNFFEVTVDGPHVPEVRSGKIFGGNVNVYYPPGYPAQYLEWVEGRPVGSYQRDYHDLNYARFLAHLKVDYVQWEPALVQHLPFKSVVKVHRSTKRQSTTFRKD